MRTISGGIIAAAGVGACFGIIESAAWNPIWPVFLLISIGVVGFGIGLGGVLR